MLETVNLDNALAAQDAVNDAAFIFAQTSSGDTVKISKADLASVVAEVMPSSIKQVHSLDLNGQSSCRLLTTNYAWMSMSLLVLVGGVGETGVYLVTATPTTSIEKYYIGVKPLVQRTIRPVKFGYILSSDGISVYIKNETTVGSWVNLTVIGAEQIQESNIDFSTLTPIELA